MKITSVPRLNALMLTVFLMFPLSIQAEETPVPRPANMTERELYLMNEIELLKNRLADLESRLNGNAARATAALPASNAAAPRQEPQPQTRSAKPEPFTFADFSWLTGNDRTKESPMDSKVFTGELRVDADYVQDFNHPNDNTIGGSSEVFRSGEVQLTQFGIGGNFHWDHIRGRLMTQFGL